MIVFGILLGRKIKKILRGKKEKNLIEKIEFKFVLKIRVGVCYFFLRLFLDGYEVNIINLRDRDWDREFLIGVSKNEDLFCEKGREDWVE